MNTYPVYQKAVLIIISLSLCFASFSSARPPDPGEVQDPFAQARNDLSELMNDQDYFYAVGIGTDEDKEFAIEEATRNAHDELIFNTENNINNLLNLFADEKNLPVENLSMPDSEQLQFLAEDFSIAETKLFEVKGLFTCMRLARIRKEVVQNYVMESILKSISLDESNLGKESLEEIIRQLGR